MWHGQSHVERNGDDHIGGGGGGGLGRTIPGRTPSADMRLLGVDHRDIQGRVKWKAVA